MSNRFTGWVVQRMKLDGWIDPEEHAYLVARIKELECEISSLKEYQVRLDLELPNLRAQLHQLDAALEAAREALESCQLSIESAIAVIENRILVNEIMGIHKGVWLDVLNGCVSGNGLQQSLDDIDHALSQIQACEVKE